MNKKGKKEAPAKELVATQGQGGRKRASQASRTRRRVKCRKKSKRRKRRA